MPIKQDARRLAVGAIVLCAGIVRSDDHRMPPGRPHTYFQSEIAQLGRDMLGGRKAILCVCRIGGDRLNAQKREEPFYAPVETAINVIEDRRQGI